MVAIDMIDLNPYISNGQYWYILTIVDYCSRYYQLYPLKRKKTELVSKTFEKFLAKTFGHNKGSPDESLKIVFSDNASEFEEKQMDEFYRNCEIKHITGRLYRPIVLVEACNNLVRMIIRQLFIRNNNLN